VNNRSYGKSNLIVEVVMILVALIFLFPLYVLLNISLKPLDEVASPKSSASQTTAKRGPRPL
jgi:raffinose/stachyose/melibiose transport system permease protein